MKRPPRICLIGAGSSGITVAKTLHERRLPFVCYEKSDRVGGNWVFKNKNGMSAAYRSLHINTSRRRMAYRDYPMPDHYPDFPHHSLIAAYFEDYVDHFGFREHIRFEAGVAEVAPEGGGYRVRLEGGAEESFDAVIVANGHHWSPRWPDPPFPGRFDGPQLHAHAYIDPTEPHDLVGKHVVIVGIGNSAMDIACELSQRGVAAQVYLSARRGAHVVPHYVFGRPLDELTGLIPPWVPFGLRAAVGRAIHRVAVGKMADYGLPEPDHRLGEAHPTISSELLPRLGRGDIVVKPNLRSMEGDRVVFEDGSAAKADAIVYCTGYDVRFPFFDEGFVSPKDNALDLFQHVFPLDIEGLYFVGLLQPLGAIMPLAEAQGKLIADHLEGRYALPPRARMQGWIEEYRRELSRRYVPSRRHTMQVDFDDYLWALEKERERGRRRAV